MSALDTSRYRSEREKTPNFRGNVLFLKTLNVRGQRGPNGTKACIENENVGDRASGKAPRQVVSDGSHVFA